MSALHLLIEKENDIDKLRELLRGGEDPNWRNAINLSGHTPLLSSIFKGEIKSQDRDAILLFARELINVGANVNLPDYVGQAPLHVAVSCRYYEMIEMLLQANAEINLKHSRKGMAALHYATMRIGFTKKRVYDTELRVISLLLKYNPEVDIQDNKGRTPLMNAVRNNNYQIVHELLKNKASVNLHDSDGKSAMNFALMQKEVNINIVLELMRHGCSFNTSIDYMDKFIGKSTNAKEVEKVKNLFKLFVFDGNYFNSHHLKSIIEISKRENRKMSCFIVLCDNEIAQMRDDELAPNYSVYNIALRSVYCKVFENNIPYEVVDKVLNKLIKGQFPLYCDLMITSICRPYVNKKFAEVCCVQKKGRKFLNFDTLLYVSFYLSELDMLNMMIAYSE